MKLTPVLIVDAIEPELDFWTGRLGFEKTVDVPEGDRLGFVILVRDGAEVMLQTWSSVEKDAGSAIPRRDSGAVALFLEVENFDALRSRLDGLEVFAPERVTFYGMREIGVLAPSGHPVVLAASVKQPA